MSDQSKKPGWTFWITATLSGVLVLYVLSVGPAYRLAHEFGTPVYYAHLQLGNGSALESFYAPIILLSNVFPPVDDALYWYLDLWI